MIPEWETNYIYFSDLLPIQYPLFWENLKKLLNKAQIKYDLLPYTSDIWCRDFMPIQLNKHDFIQFDYNPDYLKGYEFQHLRTDPLKINNYLKIYPYYSNIILDGGNVVYSKDAIILTNKVIIENKLSINYNNLLNELKRLFKTDKVYFIPKRPYDIYGHADGMIRFIDNNTLLLNDFSYESKIFQKNLYQIIENLPFDVKSIKIKFKHRFSWCYINYIHIGKKLIIPVIGHSQEDIILKQFEDFFPGHYIYTINAKSILRKGGGLHCISWNVMMEDV